MQALAGRLIAQGLAASFKSTLDEALKASLLVHVVDASDPGFERQLRVTEEVLDEIGAQDLPRLLVFNKIDRAGDAALQAEREAALRAQHPGSIVMSARREGDVAKLREAILAFFQQRLAEAELFVPGRRRSCAGTSSPAARCWRSAPAARACSSACAASPRP